MRVCACVRACAIVLFPSVCVCVCACVKFIYIYCLDLMLLHKINAVYILYVAVDFSVLMFT